MFVLQLTSQQSGAWFEVNDAGVIISQQPIIHFADCPHIDKNAQLIVLIPGEHVLTTVISPPKLRGAERLQAVRYLLEEQIASDPESVAVALGDAQSHDKTAIAVFQKNMLETALSQWQIAALYPKAVLPDFLALRYEPDAWSVVLQGDRVLVRTGWQFGFTTQVAHLILFLRQAMTQAKSKPQRIMLWQQDVVLDTATLDALGVPIALQDVAKNHFFDFSALLSKPALNLLQGKYRPKNQASDLKKNWMRCGVIAIVFVGFLLASQLLQWIYFQYTSHKITAQVETVYQQLFPGSIEVLEPRFRANALLARLQKAAQEGAFLRILRDVGNVVAQHPGVQIQQLDYDQQRLKITISANVVTQIGEIAETLRKLGFSVQQTILNTQEKQVRAELIVGESA